MDRGPRLSIQAEFQFHGRVNGCREAVMKRKRAAPEICKSNRGSLP